MFRIQRTKETVEIDSADAKFNETFSDCRDRLGKIIKGGRVLDPDLVIEAEPVQIEKQTESRFNSKRNFYADLVPDSEDEKEDENSECDDLDEVEIEINNKDVEPQQNPKIVQNGNSTEIKSPIGNLKKTKFGFK